MTTQLVTLAKSPLREWKARPDSVRIVSTYRYEIPGGEFETRFVDQYGNAHTFKDDELTDEGKKLLL